MVDQDVARPLDGRRIALLETREADRLGAMLREQGAAIVSCPTIRIVDAADRAPILAWLDRFIAQPCDDLILLSGEGLTRLHALAETSGSGPDFVDALRRTRTVARGPKPVRALRHLGLEPGLRAKEPTTTGIIALLSELNLRGRRVGLQLYPGAPDRLADFVLEAGAAPDPVTPYEYEAYASDEALAGLIEQIARGEIDAIAFTSASQIRRLFEAAQARGQADQLISALTNTAIAAVGPIVAAELEQFGLTPAIVPQEVYFMKPLVTAIIEALAR